MSGFSDSCNFRQKLLQGRRTHGLYDARGPSALKMNLRTLLNQHCHFRVTTDKYAANGVVIVETESID